MTPQKYTIFVGNPGTGKSCLLNGLLGSNLFKSGVSFGKGLTSVLQMEKSKDGCWYGDTPGLADTKMRELAAQEIEAALRRNGMYRLVFIVTIEGGRVRPEDAATIRLVTQALKKPIPFAVVLNKLAADEVRALGEPENVKLVLESLLWSCTRKTELVHLIEYETSLSGKNEALCPAIISERLKEFLGSVSFFELVEENVDNIERDSFDTVCKSIQAEMLKMRLDLEGMEKTLQNNVLKLLDERSAAFKKIFEETSRQEEALRKQMRAQLKQEMILDYKAEHNKQCLEEAAEDNREYEEAKRDGCGPEELLEITQEQKANRDAAEREFKESLADLEKDWKEDEEERQKTETERQKELQKIGKEFESLVKAEKEDFVNGILREIQSVRMKHFAVVEKALKEKAKPEEISKIRDQQKEQIRKLMERQKKEVDIWRQERKNELQKCEQDLKNALEGKQKLVSEMKKMNVDDKFDAEPEIDDFNFDIAEATLEKQMLTTILSMADILLATVFTK